MKRVITAAFLLLLVLAACFGSYQYVSRSAKAVSGMLETVQQEVKGRDLPAAQDAMQQGYTLWRARAGCLSALVRHNELDDAERLFQRAQQALESGDADEALLVLRELRSLLDYLPEMEKPTYSNLL